MRQEWVGLKIPTDSEKPREVLPLQVPPSSQNLIVIICLGAGSGVLTGARFVKALISRNLLPLWELGAVVEVGFSLPLPSHTPLSDPLRVTSVESFCSQVTPGQGLRGVPCGCRAWADEEREGSWGETRTRAALTGLRA